MKLLFVLVGSNIGGIEKSFLALLDIITEDNDISVLFFNPDGELINNLPNGVRVLEKNNTLWALGSLQIEVMKKNFWLGCKRLLWGGANKYLDGCRGFKMAMKNLPEIGEYDVAISYQHSKSYSLFGGANEYVLLKVNAKKKVAFIHGDIVNADLNTDYNHEIYSNFDKIASVSESCRKVFCNTWPDLKEKAVTVENFLNKNKIVSLAGEGFVVDNSIVNLIIVSRLVPTKAIKRTIDVFARLKNIFSNFHLYIVGDGSERDEDEKLCNVLGLTTRISFVGAQLNPYYYMKNMDALLVLSYQEAAPLVFGEAQILKLPVITTNTESAVELVKNRHLGIVCSNDEESIFETLKMVLEDRTILMHIKTNIIEYASKTAEQFIKVIEE